MDKKNQLMEHISVCICTYKRPTLLKNLLDRLAGLRTGDCFTFSIVVIDNDETASAGSVIEDFAKGSGIPVRYDVEPIRGFAHVRNKAIGSATGHYIAFIDDDEYPDTDWLYSLYHAIKIYRADGILGPILPHYDIEPPKWLLEGRFCERATFETGTVIMNHIHTRTGNVLLDSALFADDRSPFDTRFSQTGGEDTDFFKRMIARGKTFVWCHEAPVWESVPRERMKRTYFLRRALRRGFANSRHSSVVSVDACKSLTAIMLYTAALPFCLVIGQHVFLHYLIKDCDHIGKIMGFVGIHPVEAHIS
jgi:succinoglycan biosynthesis protein ExoM